MQIKVTLPNGVVVEAENGITIPELRDTISALGIANLSGANASVAASGDVTFSNPAGTRKG